MAELVSTDSAPLLHVPMLFCRRRMKSFMDVFQGTTRHFTHSRWDAVCRHNSSKPFDSLDLLDRT